MRDEANTAEAEIDITSDAAIQCPFDIYKCFREHEPVRFFRKGGFYVISRYEDIRHVLAHPKLFSSATRELMGFGPKTDAAILPARALIISDPPEHSRTRSTVDKAFTPARVNALEGKIQEIVDEIFDAVIDNGKLEVFNDIALLVPMYVISDQLGIPRADFQRFKGWSDAVAYAFNQGESPEEKEKYAAPIAEFNEYLLATQAEKTANPSDDMISVLASARPNAISGDGNEGELLTASEFCSIVQQLLVGGNETTTATILAVFKYLAEDPELFRRIKSDRSLIRSFIEETLRLESPVQGFYRLVTEDTVLSGVPLPRGAMVHNRFASANRDASKFGYPDEMDLSRKNVAQHLAFGGGAHHCIGQILARKMLTCVLGALFDRIKALSLSPTNMFRYQSLFNTRILSSLHLVFTKED